MMNIEATQPRDIAVSLFTQGRSAAEVWEALVSSGVERAAAEALVKDLLELRQMEIEQQREEEEQRGSGFCKKCYADSTWGSPGNISTTNGIGSKFYGGAESCDACGSVVRVLWVVFCYFPIFPEGTYRYRDMGGEGLFATRTRFVARRTQPRPGQALTHLAMGLALCALFILIGVVSKR